MPISADCGDQSTMQPLLSPKDVFPSSDNIYDLDEILVHCQLATHTLWIYYPPTASKAHKVTVRTTSAEGSSGKGLCLDAQNTSQARVREW